jgi:hypothetical protein
MSKILAVGLSAVFVTACPLAYAQAPSGGVLERLSAVDITALTDGRINIVKSALQLTPEQENTGRP